MKDDEWPADRDSDVTITVSGQFGSGKTTLADLMRRLLQEAGFRVTVEDPDSPVDDESFEIMLGRLLERDRRQPYPVVKIVAVQTKR